MIRGPIDGKYVELWGIPAWRRKLGIGDESETLTQRIETIVAANGGPDIGIGSVDNANARLAAFATLEEAGYVVQTSTFPPAFAGRQIVGVPNRINVTNGTGINGNTVLQTPQDIDSGATPSFQTIKPTLLTNDYVTYVNPSGELASTTITAAQLSTAVASAAAMDILTTRGDLLSHDGTTYIRVGIGAANTVARTDGLDVLWGKVVLTTDVSGVLPTANGGTNNATWTAGSVIFAGAGGLLLTEDNANLFYDDANNLFGVGTALPVTELTVVSTSAADPRGIMSAQYSTDAVGARFHFRKARGTEALPTTVVTGDVIGRIRFSGYDGANYLQMGSIDVGSSGTIGATRVPTYMSFSVATDAAPSVLTERVRIISNGNVGIGIAAPVQKLDVLGTAAGTDTFVRIGSTAGNLDAGFILYNVTDAADSWAFFRKDTGYFAISHSTGNFPAGTITARFRIETNGNVGVGPSVPLFRLDANINDAVATVTDVLRLNHSLTGGTAANFGTGILLTGETSTTDAQEMARIQTIWTTSTHATRTSALQFQTVNSAAALATGLAVTGLGQVRFGQSITLTVSALYGALITNASAASNGLIITNGIGSDFGQIAAGLYDFVTFAGTNAFQNAHGVYALTRNATTSASSNIQGAVFGFASNSTAASRANILIGGKFTVESESTGGTIAVFTAVDAVMSAVGIGQTITAVYGLRVNNLVNAGTITNTYGVHVGDITTGTQSNVPYSFISTDANARQSFAGNTGMGGGLSVGDSLTTMTLGVVNATIGYRIAGLAANQQYLRGNGTNFVSSSLVMTDASGVLPIANGGTNASSFAVTDGVVYFDGTRLVNDADLLYTSASELVSRGVSFNGINSPYVSQNINTGANSGTGYSAQLSDTSNNLIGAGYITWFKEQSWTTVAATQDSSATIGTTLNGATIAAILLHSSGSVICGKDSTSNSRIDDFLYIPSSAGNPSGTADEYGSRCPLAYDTTNNELFVYNPTDNTWRSVVLT